MRLDICQVRKRGFRFVAALVFHYLCLKELLTSDADRGFYPVPVVGEEIFSPYGGGLRDGPFGVRRFSCLDAGAGRGCVDRLSGGARLGGSSDGTGIYAFVGQSQDQCPAFVFQVFVAPRGDPDLSDDAPGQSEGAIPYDGSVFGAGDAAFARSGPVSRRSGRGAGPTDRRAFLRLRAALRGTLRCTLGRCGLSAGDVAGARQGGKGALCPDASPSLRGAWGIPRDVFGRGQCERKPFVC